MKPTGKPVFVEAPLSSGAAVGLPPPARPPTHRSRTIALIALVCASALLALSGVRLGQLESALGAHDLIPGAPPAWCYDVEAVRGARDAHQLADAARIRFPQGPSWWVADQFAALVGAKTRADHRAQLELALAPLRERCPLAEDLPILVPVEACHAAGDVASCQRWIGAFRAAARGSVAPTLPAAVRTPALESAAFVQRVLKAELAAANEVTRADAWWRKTAEARREQHAAWRAVAGWLTASLPLSERRAVLYARIAAQPFYDRSLPRSYRFVGAASERDPDCSVLIALAAETETDFSRRAQLGYGTVHLSRRPTGMADDARAFLKRSGACHAAEVAFTSATDACAAITALEARVPEVAPLIDARRNHECDIEEVLGLTKGGR